MKKNKITSRNTYFFIGIILIIFGSVYIFTRPAIWSNWDFTNTGQIGDTIGGISAPLMSLLGSVLVYISFKEQIKANKMQSNALKEEKERIALNNNYEKHLSLLDDIKNNLRELEFSVEFEGRFSTYGGHTQDVHVVYKGTNALTEFITRFQNPGERNRSSGNYKGKYNISGILLNINFILTAISDLVERINKNITNGDDGEFLLRNISLFYKGYLIKFLDTIFSVGYASGFPEIIELKSLKNNTDNLLNEYL